MFKSKVYVTLKLSKILLGKKNDWNECVKSIVNLFQKKRVNQLINLILSKILYKIKITIKKLI